MKSVYKCSSGKSLTRTVHFSVPARARHNAVGSFVLTHLTLLLRQSSKEPRCGALLSISGWFIVVLASSYAILRLFRSALSEVQELVHISACGLCSADNTFISLILAEASLMIFLHQLIEGGSVRIPVETAVPLS